MESIPRRFPMPMTIRCYECGKVFDVLLIDNNPHDFHCPACGKVEVFDLGAWEKKAIAWNKKMIRKQRGGR
jgi:phage FluMu protein Com